MKDDQKCEFERRWNNDTWRPRDSNPIATTGVMCFVICLILACYCVATHEATPQLKTVTVEVK